MFPSLLHTNLSGVNGVRPFSFDSVFPAKRLEIYVWCAHFNKLQAIYIFRPVGLMHNDQQRSIHRINPPPTILSGLHNAMVVSCAHGAGGTA